MKPSPLTPAYMEFTENELERVRVRSSRLAHIAARASTLTERLQGPWVPDETSQDAEQIAARLDAWTQAIGKGDGTRLVQRLAREGLSLDAVRPALGPGRWPPDTPLPDWTATLPLWWRPSRPFPWRICQWRPPIPTAVSRRHSRCLSRTFWRRWSRLAATSSR